MATANDVLALWASFLSGDEAAAAQLADAYGEAGDDKMAREVRSRIAWVKFTGEEPKGEVGLGRAEVGSTLHLEEVAEGRDLGYIGPDMPIALFDTRDEGRFVLVSYGPDGELVEVRVAGGWRHGRDA